MKQKLTFALKVTTALLGLAIATLAIGSLALYKYLPPETIRAYVVDTAQKSLGRQVRLGDISLNLLTGLTLRDIAISEAPDFKAGTFASARAINAQIRWWPLRHKKIIFSEITAKDLDVAIVERRNGLYNFSDLSASSSSTQATPAADTSTSSSSFVLAISRAHILDGRLIYKDTAGAETVFSTINAHVEHFRFDRPFNAALSFKIVGNVSGKPLDAAVAVTGAINLSGQGTVDIKKLSLEQNGLRAQALGTIADILTIPRIDIKASLNAKTRHLLSVDFNGTVASSTEAAGRLSVKTAGLKSAELTLLGISGYTVAPAMDIAGAFNFKNDTLTLDALRLDAPGVLVQASGKARHLVHGKTTVTGQAQFKGLSTIIAGLKLSDFSGTAVIDDKNIAVSHLRGKVADGALTMDLTVKNYATAPDIDLSADLSEFDLGKYLAAKTAVLAAQAEKEKHTQQQKPTPLLNARGHLTVGRLMYSDIEAKNITVSCNLTGISADFKKLCGSASLKVGGGRFQELGKAATHSLIIKVLTFPFMILQKIGNFGSFGLLHIFPDFNNIVFTELMGDYSFKDGVMTLKDTHLYSSAANVTTKGKIGLPDESLDLLVSARVAHIAPVDFKVTGTFTNPKTKIAVGALLQQLFKR